MYHILIKKKHQIKYKTIPNDNEFVIDTDEQINYSVVHKDGKSTNHKGCCPVIAQLQGGKKKMLKIKDKGYFSIEDAPDYCKKSCYSIQTMINIFQF